ncbi:MAG: nitroreductase family protein [Pelolinea sp.]|nr:nitroreductase family protein [Pelolinea sp.]
MENVLDLIFKRRSVRIFTKQKVEKETLIQLLQAAMAAPSASNSRPWEFVVITDKDTLSKLRSKLQYGKYNAAAAIVVCANLGIAANQSAYRFWVQDCSAATENILIAAAGMDLGTVWIGSYPKDNVMDILRETLAIPEDVFPLSLVFIGYPAEEVLPRTQYSEERVHWEQY